MAIDGYCVPARQVISLFEEWGLAHHFMFPLGESSELAEAGEAASRIFRKCEARSEETTLHRP